MDEDQVVKAMRKMIKRVADDIGLPGTTVCLLNVHFNEPQNKMGVSINTSF